MPFRQNFQLNWLKFKWHTWITRKISQNKRTTLGGPPRFLFQLVRTEITLLQEIQLTLVLIKVFEINAT